MFTKRQTLSWKPIRRGAIYCSPGCGGGCQWAEYQNVKRIAEKTAKELGRGWKVEVWENLGWHCQVLGPVNFKVHINFRKGMGIVWDYSAWLELKSGGIWTDAKTAKKAVQKAIQQVKKESKELQATIDLLDKKIKL